MNDFWLSCGHHLLDRADNGGLVVTDDFLKVYLARPELVPPAEAGPAERALYASLLTEPRRPIAAQEIAAVEDADARENWQVLIAFRDHLLRHETLEGAYLDLMRHGPGPMPSLFINQLVHVILRNALDDCDDAQVIRAAELFFRPQRVTLHEGSLLAADEEVIGGINPAPTSPLVSMLGIPNEANIDVLNAENTDQYWDRSDQFDMAIDLSAGQPGLDALAKVIERWVGHLLGLDVAVTALPEMRDVNLVWYVGLDADATKLGDTVWKGEELDQAAATRLIGLFKMEFRDPSVLLDKVRGEPVYLILAMTPDKLIRMKPQNLVTGLPVKHFEAVG
ncbi:MAG: hypothetical protein JOZ70_04465 [Pseudolabrys sp.]|nr:hypothetical protein [Pseudolabrys sp.]